MEGLDPIVLDLVNDMQRLQSDKAKIDIEYAEKYHELMTEIENATPKGNRIFSMEEVIKMFSESGSNITKKL